LKKVYIIERLDALMPYYTGPLSGNVEWSANIRKAKPFKTEQEAIKAINKIKKMYTIIREIWI